MRIRTIKKEDSKDIFIWRNDEISRNMFLDSRVITFKEHKEWFKKAINDKNIDFFIGENEVCKLGIVRFNFNSKKNFSEVSINMNPYLRGKGLGKLFLKSSILKYIKNNKNNIVAKVKSDNLASIKIFTHSGFEIIQDKDNRIYFEKEFKK